MKRIALGAALLAVLAFSTTGVAQARSELTIASLQQKTTAWINGRLKFAGKTDRVRSTRCQTDSSVSWFCIVKLNDPYGVLTEYFFVTLSGNTISWKLQR